MFNEIIFLIDEMKSVDDYGDTNVQEIEHMCFAKIESIGASEFYQSMAVGMRPEIKFVIADYLDYNGQKFLRYTDFRNSTAKYNIIRTFRKNNNLELICQLVVENGRA